MGDRSRGWIDDNALHLIVLEIPWDGSLKIDIVWHFRGILGKERGLQVDTTLHVLTDIPACHPYILMLGMISPLQYLFIQNLEDPESCWIKTYTNSILKTQAYLPTENTKTMPSPTEETNNIGHISFEILMRC
jgi:hypothetical protein